MWQGKEEDGDDHGHRNPRQSRIIARALGISVQELDKIGYSIRDDTDSFGAMHVIFDDEPSESILQRVQGIDKENNSVELDSSTADELRNLSENDEE